MFRFRVGTMAVLVVSSVVLISVFGVLFSPSRVIENRATTNFNQFLERRNSLSTNKLEFLSCSGVDSDSDGYVTCTAIDAAGRDVNYLCSYNFSLFGTNACTPDKRRLNIN